jgi:hypothetical protein
VLGLALLSAAMSTPSAAQGQGVSVRASIDERAVEDSTESRPIRLAPKEPSLLSVEVDNRAGRAVTIKTVRLEGKVVGLTFFAYDTAVGFPLAAGATGSRRFILDLAGLDGQATGLIPGSVQLLDPDRRVVAEESAVFDVRGSLFSVYGLFGLGVALITVVSFIAAMVGLARHRLPANRWRRALRFLTPGLGLGLVVNFTLSAARVFVPGLGRWLTIMVVSGLVFFALGYLTPTPPDEEEDEEEYERPLLIDAQRAPAIESQTPDELPSPASGTSPMELAQQDPDA